MDTLEKKLMDCIKEYDAKLEKNAELKAFEKTSSDFEDLVKKGLIKKRGNNILSSAESLLKSQVSFNTI